MFFYRFDVDFVTFDQQSQTRPTIFDAYLDTLNLPVIGNLRVGHFREPFSIERLSSTHDLPFMERSLAVNTLSPFRNLGIMPFDWNDDETMTWSYGFFNENSNEFGEDLSDRAGISGTGRVTWLAVLRRAGEGSLLGASRRELHLSRVNDQQRRFVQPPEVVLKENGTRTPNFIDTGHYSAQPLPGRRTSKHRRSWVRWLCRASIWRWSANKSTVAACSCTAVTSRRRTFSPARIATT